jgi:hypothetical protein
MSSEAPISAVDIEQGPKRFEGAWQRGEQPVDQRLLQELGPRRHAVSLALVLIDFDCRLKSGQSRRADDYLREFPRLQSHQEVVRRAAVASKALILQAFASDRDSLRLGGLAEAGLEPARPYRDTGF